MATEPSKPAPAAWLGRFIRRHPTIWPAMALIALFAFNLLTTENFGRFRIVDGRVHGPVIDILKDASPVMLLSTGMTLVIATAGIDLSVGSVMALAGTVAALLLTAVSAPVPVAVAGGLAAGALCGLWNGLLVTRVRLQPIIATLILLVAGRGAAQTLTGDQKVSFEVPSFEAISMGTLLGLPIPIYIAAGVAAVMFVVLRKTVLGMYIEAVGANLRAARLAGLRTHAIRIFVYAFSGLCAAVAGLIATADIKQADVANCGLYMELDAIMAVVIGGTALTGGKPRLVGSLFGAVIMQTLGTMLTMRQVIVGEQLIVKALVALAVCFLQSPLFARGLSLLSGRRRAAA